MMPFVSVSFCWGSRQKGWNKKPILQLKARNTRKIICNAYKRFFLLLLLILGCTKMPSNIACSLHLYVNIIKENQEIKTKNLKKLQQSYNHWTLMSERISLQGGMAESIQREKMTKKKKIRKMETSIVQL